MTDPEGVPPPDNVVRLRPANSNGGPHLHPVFEGPAPAYLDEDILKDARMLLEHVRLGLEQGHIRSIAIAAESTNGPAFTMFSRTDRADILAGGCARLINRLVAD